MGFLCYGIVRSSSSELDYFLCHEEHGVYFRPKLTHYCDVGVQQEANREQRRLVVSVEHGEVGRQEHDPHEQRRRDRHEDVAGVVEILRQSFCQVTKGSTTQDQYHIEDEWRQEGYQVNGTRDLHIGFMQEGHHQSGYGRVGGLYYAQESKLLTNNNM